MGYDPQQCLNNLNSKGLGPACQNLITPFHCDDVTGLDPGYHQTCATAGIYYFPIICLVCHNSVTNDYRYFPSATFYKECGNLNKQDPNWEPAQCYCCCSCLAKDTLIAVPNGVRPIDSLAKGDPVLAASLGSDLNKIQWSTANVTFSAGTNAAGHQPMMVYIAFDNENILDLICNTDQPFLLSDGRYTTAGRLTTDHYLVDKDGKPVKISLVSIGSYDGGVHHISTDQPWYNNPDGHLLLAGNVVAGDYTMQLHFNNLPEAMKEKDYENKPLLGTPEYESTYYSRMKRSDVVFEFTSTDAISKNIGKRQMTSGLFKAYRISKSGIPIGAQAMFTQGQAHDILKNGVQTKLSNPIPQTIFNTIKTQLSGFFPDIDFYYDHLDMTPNVYAFEAYGRKVVQLNGGLARLKDFNYEGLFMAMAHGVACFEGGDPKNAAGYSAVGQADAFAFGTISRLCWVSDPFLKYIMTAMSQWITAFGLVSPQNAKGNPKDPLNDPSLDCRIATIQSAAAGGSLPECAGGNPTPKISLEKATATSMTEVVLNFSLAIENDSATDIKNYILCPEVKINSAALDSATGFIVHLNADLDPDTRYELTVQNLVSILGSGLDPAHTAVEFDSPKNS